MDFIRRKKLLFRSYYNRSFCEAVLLLSAIVFSPVKYAVSQISTYFFCVPKLLSSVILWIIFFVFFVVPYLRGIKIYTDSLFLFIVLNAYFLMFIILHPEDIMLAGTLAITVIIRAFPYYIIARNIKDYQVVKNYLVPAGYIITISMFIVFMVKYISGTFTAGGWYDMSFAYMLLPGGIIAFKNFFDNVSFIASLNLMIDIFMLLLVGTRGPVLIMLLYIFYEIVVNGIMVRRLSIKKVSVILAAVISVFVGIRYIVMNVERIISVTGDNGFSIRLFYLLANGSLANNVGRAPLWHAAGQLIARFPLTGVGLITDRWMIAAIYYQGIPQANQIKGCYSHLVWLDWLVEFGIIIGGAMILFSLYIILDMLRRKRDAYRYCMEVLVFAAFVPLFLSMQYIQVEAFWIIFGFAINFVKRERRIVRL